MGSACTRPYAAAPTTARRWNNCAATSRARLAGRARPVAGPLAKHKQSTGLFVSGLGFGQRARANQRRRASRAQAQDRLARRHHALGDLAAGVHAATGCAGAQTQAAPSAECEATCAYHRPVRLSWAKLLKRVIEKTLTHLGLQADCGRMTAPARGHAPQEELKLANAGAARGPGNRRARQPVGRNCKRPETSAGRCRTQGPSVRPP